MGLVQSDSPRKIYCATSAPDGAARTNWFTKTDTTRIMRDQSLREREPVFLG